MIRFPFNVRLTGVSYGNCQDNIKQFGCPDTGYYILIRESENPHDPMAIAVSLSGVWHMGYIPRFLASTLAPMMDEGKEFNAEFVCRNEHPTEELVGLTVRIFETTS